MLLNLVYFIHALAVCGPSKFPELALNYPMGEDKGAEHIRPWNKSKGKNVRQPLNCDILKLRLHPSN